MLHKNTRATFSSLTHKRLLLGGIFALLYTFALQAQTIRYVKATASGLGNGSSWANASANLQAMINASAVHDEVWVAAGTYKPTNKRYNSSGVEETTTDNRDKTFHVKDGVRIYGGFKASAPEILLSARDISANVTILSGDIGTTGNNTDNCYHVLIAYGNKGVTIDGFSITGGNANGSGNERIPQNKGGGIYIESYSGTITLTNNTIYSNSASSQGGGIYTDGGTASGTATLTNNTIYSNSASEGGGIYTLYTKPTLTNNTIYSNSATSNGGGIYTNYGTATLTNNTIYSNSASSRGGGIYTSRGGNELKNNIFWQNKIGTNANVAQADYTNDNSENLWKNNLMQLASAAYTSVTYNDLGTSPSGNIFAQNPLFVSTTAPFNLRLQACGPAVNAGLNSAVSTIPTDITGANRVQQTTVDMGAYESSSYEPITASIAVTSNVGNYVLNLTTTGTTFLWSNAATTEDITVSTLGTYTVTVSNSIGCTTTSSTTVAGTLYVDASKASNGVGTSWATAYKSLGDALAFTHANTSYKIIKVAAGTYKPTKKPFNSGTEITTTDGRDLTFHIPDGVTIEGGYNASTGARDITANVTTLSGDIGTTGSISDNCYHVVLTSTALSNTTSMIKVDGFAITAANANVTTTITVNGRIVGRNNGGGISTNYGTATLTNNTIYSNSAGYGGGISTNYGTATLTNNMIYSNSATSNGGGIYTAAGTTTLTNNTIYSNSTSSRGGGIYTSLSTNTLTNNIFWQNKIGTNANVAQADYTDDNSSNLLKNNLMQLASNAYTSVTYNYLDPILGGNIFAQDPLFVVPTAPFNLGLQACSPAVNTGLNSAVSDITTDITGANRVQQTTVDMGAYESSHATPPTASITVSNNTAGNYVLNLTTTGTTFLWSNAATTEDITVSTLGTYTVTVSNSIGCTATSSTTLIGTLYVDAARPSNGAGTSWAMAYKSLGDALALANGNTTYKIIKVAKGTYKPTKMPFNGSGSLGSRDFTFQIPKDVTIEGGYNASTGARDITGNVTILSGDIGTTNVQTDNCYHVVIAGSGVKLDGFTITDGYCANGLTTLSPKNSGGGIQILNCTKTVTITNNTIYNNTAVAGGGIFAEKSQVIITNNIIYRNSQIGIAIGESSYSPGGAGIYLSECFDFSKLINNTIYGNAGGEGRGLYSYQSRNTFAINNIFWGHGFDQAYYCYGNPDEYIKFWCNLLEEPEAVYTNGFHHFMQSGSYGNKFELNPLFVSTVWDDIDLRLQAGSPCISAVYGAASSNIPATDITGAPRTGGPDIGAYDYCTPPIAYTVTGAGTFCGSGAVGLSNSQIGVSYQLKNGSSDVGAAIAGTGAAISFGNQTVTGNYTVVATSGGCKTTMTGTAAVTVIGNTLHVNASVVGGTGDGTSWANAYSSLSEALAKAHTCNIVKTIKVAAGTYKPTKKPFNSGIEITTTDNRDRTFHIPDGVTIEGGYDAATGNRLPSFGGAGGGSILSGDFNNNDAVSGSGSTLSITNNSENAYHVVLAAANSSTGIGVKIDGFSIIGGNANGSSSLTINGTPILQNYGGGVNTFSGINQLSNNIISGNSAEWGAGIYTSFGTNTISSNILYKNSADNGGGFRIEGGTNTISNNAVFENSVTGNGGGISIFTSMVSLNNNTFSENYALGVGGGVRTVSGTIMLNNNIIWGNKRGSTASNTVVNADFSNSSAENTFKNNLLQLASSDYSIANLNYLGASASGNIFGQNPLFANTADPDGADNTYRTADDGLNLQSNSPAINVGTSSDAPTIDITGTIRSGNPDIGAYEYCLSPTAFNVTGGGALCPNDDGGVGISLSNSETGVSYQLKNGVNNIGLPISGTGTSLNFGNHLEPGIYTVVATSTTGGCTLTMIGNATIIINPLPTTYNVTGDGAYCAGSDGVEVSLSGSQTGVSYQLKKDNVNKGTAVAGTGSAISFGKQTEVGVYTVTATSLNGCLATMNIGVTVTINPLPTAYTVTGGGSYCVGGTGVAIGLSGSEIGTNYQLKNGTTNVGTAVAGTGATISFGAQTTAATYTVVATRTDGGCANIMTGSATIIINPLPTTYNVTGGGTYCAGLDGIEVGLSGSQTGVAYQLKRINVNVGATVTGTGSTISFGKQTVAGSYTVSAISVPEGCTSSMQGSKTVSIDETLPAIVAASVPANVTVNCHAIPAPATPTVTNSCSTISLAETSDKATNATQCKFYAYTITRTWTATDKRGNTATRSQVITVQDKTAPVIAPLSNITVTEGTIPTTISNTDNCMASPIVTFSDVTVNNTLPECKTYSYTLTRTWRVTDACNNSSTRTQTIRAEGIKLSCPSDKTIYTNSDGLNNYDSISLATATMGLSPIPANVSSTCNDPIVHYDITGATTAFGNGSVAGVAFKKGVSTITYKLISNVIDQCTLKLTVLDNEGPRFTLTPTVILDTCTIPNPIPDTYKPTVSDNCTGTNTLVIMSDVFADVTGCSTKPATEKYTKSLTRTWKATDENGNTATTVQKFCLRDMAPPITVCKNITVSIGSANITQPVSSLNNGSNDKCSAATALTFTGCLNTTTSTPCTNFANSLTLRSSMIPAGQTMANITVLVKAKDGCGNETATPVSTIITLKKMGTLNNTTNGNDNSIAIQDTESSIPTEASTVPTVQGEMKCYPTPFSEDLNIQYNLTENVEMVTLKVYDTQGRLVTKMEQEAQVTGFYQVRWNLSDLSAGMYHVCLELNGKCTKMERVIMMK